MDTQYIEANYQYGLCGVTPEILGCKTIPYEEQTGIKELRQAVKEKTDFGKEFTKFRNDNPHKTHAQCRKEFHELYNSLGTLPETQTKETTMFHNDFDIPTPRQNLFAKAQANSSTVGPINMAVSMPAPQDPAEKGKSHLLMRAAQAQNGKFNDLRKTYNLVPDAEPETIKDFVQRVKDGKFIVDLTEKEQAEREFYSVERILEEFTWQDPDRKPDNEGFEKANEILRTAYNDVYDEITVKTPEAGLEALRAFQAKTFN